MFEDVLELIELASFLSPSDGCLGKKRPIYQMTIIDEVYDPLFSMASL